ncbi:MAG: putative ATP-binding protein involved in virulence [bacterium]|jgi:predicted ATP-binding protein involved in virulence
MKIDAIEIENFKLFVNSEFHFNSKFNLIVGVNGSGKTSLLRAVAVALGGWAHAYIKNKNNLRAISDDEIREVQIDKRFDKTKSTYIKAFGTSKVTDDENRERNAKINWMRQRIEGSDFTNTIAAYIQFQNDGNESYSQSLPFNFLDSGNGILEFIEKGNTFDLPLIAFYECDRLWITKKELDIDASAKHKYSRFDPYIDCFHTGSDDQAIGDWLLKQELISIQKKEETPTLQSIKNAAISALENCSGFRFDFEESRVMVEFNNGTTTPFEHLSDGQRTILGLFCDIARRAAILNPHLGGDAHIKIKGVVLIDELDLHLHPKWQRRVIEDLRTVFPNIQFICTTHSPFLIQSLRSSEELIMLDGEPLAEYGNKGIEEIAKNMGVIRPDVSTKYEEMKEVAKTFLQLLDESSKSPKEKQEAYKQQLAKLIAPYAENPAYQAFLELKYAAKMREEL